MKILNAALLIGLTSSALFAQEAPPPAQNTWTVTGPLILDGIGTLTSECVCTGFNILHTGQILIQFNVGSSAGVFDDDQWQYAPNYSSAQSDPATPTWDGWHFGMIPKHAKFRILSATPGSKVYGYTTTAN